MSNERPSTEQPSTPDPDKLHEKISPSNSPAVEELPHLDIRNRSHDQPLHAERTAYKALLLAVTAYTAALVFALGHYFFLHHMNGRKLDTTVGKYAFGSQFWIKAANNFFAKAAAVCLGIVTTTALVQVIWQTLGSTYTSIGLIDDLFSLPSPLATFAFLTKIRSVRWLPTLSIALLVNLLLIVSSFAPSSFTVGPPENVPSPSLDPATTKENFDTAYWDTLISSLFVIDPSLYWVVPEDCKEFCTYTVHYDAPSLTCTDLPQDQITLPAYSPSLLSDTDETGGWVFYNSTGLETNPPSFLIEYRAFNVSYGTNNLPTSAPVGSVGGQICQYSNASYDAEFSYLSGERIVTTQRSNYTNFYADNCAGNEYLSEECKNYDYISSSIQDGFTYGFWGTWSWQSFGISGVFYAPIIQQLINYDNSSHIISVHIPTSNLSGSLEDLFDNVTLSTLMRYTAATDTSAYVYDFYDGSVWRFAPLLLLAIYVPTFALVLAAALYALIGVSIGGMVWDRTFSSIFIATRSKDLDVVCSQDRQVIKSTLLRHDGGHGQFMTEDASHSGLSPTTPRLVTLTQTTANRWARETILGSFGFAVVLAVGHHLYLRALDGTDSHFWPQSWVRGANNMFATAVVVCLGIAANFSLVQANWRAVKLHQTNFRTLDGLFALPSLKALSYLARGVKNTHVLYVATIALLIQALALVSILAPGALEVNPSPLQQEVFTVPGLNFSSKIFAGSTDPDSYWSNLLTGIDSLNATNLWNPPYLCGVGCNFTVPYSAPKLTCRDLADNELSIRPPNATMSPSSNWTFYAVDDSPLFLATQWEGNQNPSFTINYIPVNFQITNDSLNVTSQGRPSGTSCQCNDGFYQSQYRLSNNNKTIITPPPTDGTQLTNCTWSNLSSGDQSACGIYGSNSLHLCRNFADNLAAGLYWEDGDIQDGVYDRVLLDKLFNYEAGNTTYSFQLRSSNLTEAMVDVFDNLVSTLLPELNQTTTTTADVVLGYSQWAYKRPTLWTVYAAGFGTVLAIMAYGFFCIHANGTALDMKFSTIMITTRSGDLDDVYRNSATYYQFMHASLKYDKRGNFAPAERRTLEEK